MKPSLEVAAVCIRKCIKYRTVQQCSAISTYRTVQYSKVKTWCPVHRSLLQTYPHITQITEQNSPLCRLKYPLSHIHNGPPHSCLCLTSSLSVNTKIPVTILSQPAIGLFSIPQMDEFLFYNCFMKILCLSLRLLVADLMTHFDSDCGIQKYPGASHGSGE